MNDQLTNAHNLEKKMGHDKRATLSKHQAQLEKQEAQATKHVALADSCSSKELSSRSSHPDLAAFCRGRKIVIQGPHVQRLDSVLN